MEQSFKYIHIFKNIALENGVCYLYIKPLVVRLNFDDDGLNSQKCGFIPILLLFAIKPYRI